MSKKENMTRGQAVAGLLLLSAIFPLCLFPFAGRWDWAMGWVLIGIMIIATLASRLLTMKVHPGLLDERSGSMQAENTKPWDKWLSPLMALTPLLILMIAGLDQRYQATTSFSQPVQMVGLVLVVFGYAIATWAMIANRFFSAVVRIQTERGHHVVDKGPYAIVRHPGYAGSLLACLGFPLALSSIWAFAPLLLVIIVTITRTRLEDRTLQEELPGYSEFAERTRFRLLPGVW